MNCKPTILVFAEYGWRNGGENSWLSVAKELRNAFDFVVACPLDTELSNSACGMGIRSVEWNVQDTDGTRKSQSEIRSEIAVLISSQSPALVHCNSLATSRLVGPVTKEMGRRSVGYLRDIMKVSKRAIEDINCVDQIVAVSNATRKFHVRQGLESEKTQVIHNGVDLTEFLPRERTGFLHHELGVDSNTRLVVCVGQIGMRKGTDVVIKSFLGLAKQFNELALLLIGIRNSVKTEAVEFEAECHRLSKDSSSVFWLGRRTDVPKIMNEASLLLHAARQEPFGRVMLESLAAGLPFVATDVGGTREMIAGLEDYLVLCPSGSVDSMVENAARILDNYDLRGQIAGQMRLLADQKYGIERCADRLGKLYQSLIPEI